LALYVHWPFCVSKCPYCDFNSHVRAEIDQDKWREALLADLAHEARLLPGRKLTSIFFGGGTPSLMDPGVVESVIGAAKSHWRFASDVEITLEANPNSVEAGRFADLAGAGVNRLSLGLQSFDDQALRFLGRAHSARQGFRALEIAQKNFRRVSFDLIYALPGDTAESWSAMLAQALSLGTAHLSLYQLTIEPGTHFAAMVQRRELEPLDADSAASLYELTDDMTSCAGVPSYEISNYARPRQESRHNLTYWRYGDYAGIGPGAHGRLTQGREKIATATERRPETWLEQVEAQGHGMIDREILGLDEQADELLLMGLRLREGVDLARWQELSGRDLDPVREERLLEHGFVERLGNSRLRCTPSGMLILDAVVADLAC
jgi:oxygen-independent coproporphyrinogen-3 oxidase